MTSHVEPRDLWAEQSILGCVLATGRTSDDLTSDLFWDPHHLAVFQAADAMTAAGEPVTGVTVRAELMRRKYTGKVTEAAWLFSLEQAACLPAQVGYYASKLRELATRRALIALAERTVQAAENPSTDVHDLAAVCSIEAGVLADTTSVRAPTKVRTIDEFLDGPTDYDWLIEGLLERMDRCLFTGGEGSGKSVLSRQVAVCAAAGVHPFTGQRVPPVRVLLIDLENPEKLLRRHLRGLIDHCNRIGRPVDPAMLAVESHSPGIDLTDATERTWLEEKARTVRPELLVIGPLYRMHAADMNDEQAARHMTRVIDGLRAEHGCAIVMETHSPHGYQGSRSLRPIGSSLFMRWPEFGYGLKAEDGSTQRFQFIPWRGPRDSRSWPQVLVRGGQEEWPWAPGTVVPGVDW